MRTFAALELPEETRSAMGRVSEALRKKGLDASWVKPHNMHLTLRFYGEVAEDSMSLLKSTLANCLQTCCAPLLIARGVGAFPSVKRPSILWVGVQALSGNLECIQAATESAALEIGLAHDPKAFHPHVTLARIRRSVNSALTLPLLEPYLHEDVPPEFGEAFTPSNVLLFRSTLTPRGPNYQVLQEFPLQ